MGTWKAMWPRESSVSVVCTSSSSRIHVVEQLQNGTPSVGRMYESVYRGFEVLSMTESRPSARSSSVKVTLVGVLRLEAVLSTISKGFPGITRVACVGKKKEKGSGV